MKSPSTSFEASKLTTDSNNYTPLIKLPEHLEQYRKDAQDIRQKMIPLLQNVLKLTDIMALRGAATLPEGH